MKYFMIESLGDVDGERAIADRPPRGLGLEAYRLAKGERAAEVFPDDAWIPMSKHFRGLKLDSLLGNTLGYLMVHKDVRPVIEKSSEGIEIEYFPFVLKNQKNRVHSTDYVIVNPLGTVDCLDLEASEVKYLDAPDDAYHGAVVDVLSYVLDPAKLRKAPALFRVREKPNRYLVNETLAKAFHQAGFTNIILTELPVSGAPARR